MKVLIDTCVILDYLQAREPFFDHALNIMIGAANREFEGYITASSMTDLFYIVNKHTRSSTETARYLSRLTQLVGILETKSEDCINALYSGMSDYEDAVMTETAIREEMDYIVTRNSRDYTDNRIRVTDPASFLMVLAD